MPKRTSTTGSELFIVDNSDTDWKVLRYLHEWCDLSSRIDVATGCFKSRRGGNGIDNQAALGVFGARRSDVHHAAWAIMIR